MPRFLVLAALTACVDGAGNGDTDPDDDPVVGDLDHVAVSGTTDADGLFEVEVEVGPEHDAFLLEAWSDDGYLSIEELRGPSGEVVTEWQDWNGSQSLTNSFYDWYRDVAFNWPVRDEDGPLEPGTWTVVVASTDGNANYTGGVGFDGAVLLKSDDDLDAGEVRVRVVYAAGVDDDAAVVEAVEGAVERWREIWDQAGLSLVVRYASSDIDAALDVPDSNNQGIDDASQDSELGELTMLIGDDIDDDPWWLGYAGGIPGALEPGPRSAVIIGWASLAGQDLEFDDDEVRIMGETMAHEVGHYQGLFHPVESGFDYWDALSDTPQCGGATACERDLAANLMFPYTVCNDTFCEAQDDLTADQIGVVHHYTGTP